MSECDWPGCERPTVGQGLCHPHYEQRRRGSDLHDLREVDPIKRFWSKAVKAEGDGACWLWRAAMSDGYGSVGWGGRIQKAHRVAYELTIGPIPEGLELDHLCRNGSCINPTHLEPVTGRINNLRGESFAARNARRTHCINGHEFTPENTAIYPSRRQRVCLACKRQLQAISTERSRLRQRDYMRRWRAKNRLRLLPQQ